MACTKNYDAWSLDFELRHVALLVKVPQFEDNTVDFEI